MPTLVQAVGQTHSEKIGRSELEQEKKKGPKKEADKINGEETMVSQKLWAKLFILEERAVVRPKEEQKVKI